MVRFELQQKSRQLLDAKEAADASKQHIREQRREAADIKAQLQYTNEIRNKECESYQDKIALLEVQIKELKVPYLIYFWGNLGTWRTLGSTV